MEQKICSFMDLFAWREGHDLVIRIYHQTKSFPKAELFGLISQMRRAAVSITSNIAEGFTRKSATEKIQFYKIAQGSLTELQNQLLVSRDVGYISRECADSIFNQTVKVNKIIYGLINKLAKY